ncbi:hypothetical protein ACQ4LE_001920 [Meloidogyne hapla]|uniref:Cadherin domain-containing protein n=1 Tax=Meloidogyne hapla TaxID=6305 RepID=A0A1I8C085_MELHA
MDSINTSIVEHGTARLAFHEASYSLKGLLTNNTGETYAICGTPATDVDNSPDKKMQLIVVDDETGDKFYIKDVIIKLVHEDNGVVQKSTPKIEIDTTGIKFMSDEVLIGNRADIEIRRFLQPDSMNGESSKQDPWVVHVGKMHLSLTASEMKVPQIKRSSISQPDDTVIEWVQNDFLV